MELGEYLMKILQIVAIIIALLALVVNSMSFTGVLETFSDQRAAIDFAQAVLSAPCLVHDIDGDGRKGLLDYDKVSGDKIRKEGFCLGIAGEYNVKIRVGEETVTFGSSIIKDGETVTVPALMRYSYDNVVPAKVDVKVKLNR